MSDTNRRRPRPGLRDLDDAVLVNIFGRLAPLPHLFNVRAVCKRFNKLAGDGRLSLRVAGLGSLKPGAAGHRRLAYNTLHEAVIASRPGDTVVMEPGVAHIVRDVSVEWPLRILGGGTVPEDTLLCCLTGADSALSFRASGVLTNLSVTSEQAACVTHICGRLLVDSCALESASAPGLEHLFTPIVTCAAVSALRPGSTKRRRLDPTGCAGERAPTADGVLCVRETRIRSLPQGTDGMRAVETSGSGRVAGVRVINLSADALFWFEVDASAPARGAPRAAAPASVAVDELPAWAKGGAPLFPGAVRLAPGGPAPAAQKAPSQADLELKSKAWVRGALGAEGQWRTSGEPLRAAAEV